MPAIRSGMFALPRRMLDFLGQDRQGPNGPEGRDFRPYGSRSSGQAANLASSRSSRGSGVRQRCSSPSPGPAPSISPRGLQGRRPDSAARRGALGGGFDVTNPVRSTRYEVRGDRLVDRDGGRAGRRVVIDVRPLVELSRLPARPRSGEPMRPCGPPQERRNPPVRSPPRSSESAPRLYRVLGGPAVVTDSP